jgi:hypothetical protein
MATPPVAPDERAPRSVTVAVASVDGGGRRGGGSRRAAVLAAVAVVTVLALAIVSSRLFPVDQPAFVPPSAAPSAEASVPPSPAASPDGPPVYHPVVARTPRIPWTALDVAALVAAVDAKAEGPLAFVSGILRITPRPCAEAIASACDRLSIDGLRGVRVVPDDGLNMPMRQPGGGEVLVVRPSAGHLVYLGSLAVDPLGIPRIDGLLAILGQRDTTKAIGAPTLFEADGRLIRLSHNCPETASCPPPSWLLGSAQWPDTRVDVVVDATVQAGAFGIGADTGWTSGPFLLRPGAGASGVPGTGHGAAWVVVALEDQAAVLHIVIP